MIYVRVGLFAEGRTDYDFLLGVLDQLVEACAARRFEGRFDAAPAVGIDAPRSLRDKAREDRIAAAIDANWNDCTLFVVHSDGAGDPEGTRRSQIDPGLGRSRLVHGDFASAPCVPVRETEAWMLADAGAFSRIFETTRVPALPSDPEAVGDPKKLLHDVLVAMGAKTRDITKYYADLGKEVRLTELRRLAAFRRFELDLDAAMAWLPGAGGT